MKIIKNIHHCQYEMLKKNMQNIYSEQGKKLIAQLPTLVDELSAHWKLHELKPVNNMSFHFVAKAVTESNQPVVLKIGIDKKVLNSEMCALKFFNGHAAVQLIDYHSERNAMLLQQALPGTSLKSLYPTQVDVVMDEYIKTINNLHNKPLPVNHIFPHIREWLIAIDQVRTGKLPKNLLEKAIELKTTLLNSSKNEILLHGDLHHDNILLSGKEWVVIDPKGIIGEVEFEIAAFDFIHISELNNKDLKSIFKERIKLIANKANLDPQRLDDWVFVRLILSAAWSIEDNDDPSWAINLAGLLC